MTSEAARGGGRKRVMGVRKKPQGGKIKQERVDYRNQRRKEAIASPRPRASVWGKRGTRVEGELD